MFLHILNDRQQRAFLALAKQFIEADAHLADEERNLVELMHAEAGLPMDAELPEDDRASLLEAFDSRQARAVVLLELTGLGHADETFHAEESAFLREVAQQLGMGEGELSAMESWVTRQLALAREVEQFWQE